MYIRMLRMYMYIIDSIRKYLFLIFSNIIFLAMGEAAPTPHNNESSTSNDESEEMETDDEDMSPEEFLEIDNHLNALNSALDDIEKRNDDLNAKLIQLLQANREIRREMQSSEADKNEETN